MTFDIGIVGINESNCEHAQQCIAGHSNEAAECDFSPNIITANSDDVKLFLETDFRVELTARC
jgi:uncharacterized Fe-S cluster protein YjdI